MVLFQEAFEHDDAITYYLMSVGKIDTSAYSLKGVIFSTMLSVFTNVGLYELGKMIFGFVGFLTIVGNPNRIKLTRTEAYLIFLTAIAVSYIAMTGLKEILVLICLVLVLRISESRRKKAFYFLLLSILLFLIRPVALLAIASGLVIYKFIRILSWPRAFITLAIAMGFQFDLLILDQLIPGYTKLILFELETRTNFVLVMTNLREGYITVVDIILILMNGIVSPVFTIDLELQAKTSYSLFLTLPVLISIFITRHSVVEIIFQNENKAASYMLLGLFCLASFALLTPFPEIPRLKMTLYGVLLHCLINKYKFIKQTRQL